MQKKLIPAFFPDRRSPVVDHFITDFQRTGGFSGFPALGIHWQRMESEALRRAFRMAPGQKGARRQAAAGSSALSVALCIIRWTTNGQSGAAAFRMARGQKCARRHAAACFLRSVVISAQYGRQGGKQQGAEMREHPMHLLQACIAAPSFPTTSTRRPPPRAPPQVC